MRKKVDERIRTLIENGVKRRHRSMFVIIGDKSRDQIVNLHYMLSKSVAKSRPSVLWCYKDKLELSSHKKKRAKQVKKRMQQGLLDPEKADPFSLFVETTGITYCLYRDSERILGNTFGMCILQDFEALTPNLLARTIETVEGGGLIVLLLRSLSSLTSLYTMVMDVHERFRTESHSLATGHFNERFLLSLASCKSCIFMDDEVNILPISSHMRAVASLSNQEDLEGLSEAERELKTLKEQLNDDFPVGPLIRKCCTMDQDLEGLSEAERELKTLKEQLNDDFPVGPLIRKCCTMDQGKAVVSFLDAILDKNLRSTIALLASRGRGKSAALGLAISGAVAAGYSNIFVTAPSPENLKTLFQFICKGFDSLEYMEHLDYDVVKSSNPQYKKATVRINIYKQHRQTIQALSLLETHLFEEVNIFIATPTLIISLKTEEEEKTCAFIFYIEPHEHEKLSQVELLVVDEAAAIPLPIVKSLLGPYLVFLSSTVNGYEGTGRSLSLKLIKQLEEQNQISSRNIETAVSGRLFKKIELSESIRYASGDPIESWLNALLCLDVTNSIPSISRLPPPSECDLYYVNRDTLFSFHKDSELFLQRMMALCVASHYKNTPDDLQLMADAPAHHLFVLLGPVDESKNHLPDILCVIQICFEGQICSESAFKSLNDGRQPSGDVIPWKFCEQFRDTVFPSLSGARIVRIATHPSAMRLGYGSAAIELLSRYFEGQLTAISEELDVDELPDNSEVRVVDAAEKASLLEENIKPRTDLPPLLVPLRERRPEKLHYLGVSFGLTLDLFRFWRKHNFTPFYIASNANSVTGEHSCMVVKPLQSDDIESSGLGPLGYISPFHQVFKKKFIKLLTRTFRQMEYKLAMSILDPKINFSEVENALYPSTESLNSISETLSSYALVQLESYTNNLAPHQMTEDFVDELARSYFLEKIPISLSYSQASILLCFGLQGKNMSRTAGELKLENQQVLSLYLKVMKKFYKYLSGIASKETLPSVSRLKEISLEPHPVSVDDDLNDGAKQVEENMRSKLDVTLNPEFLQQYAIVDKEADFENALKGSGKVLSGTGVISIKSDRKKVEKKVEETQKSHKKRKNKHDHTSKSNKKRKKS